MQFSSWVCALWRKCIELVKVIEIQPEDVLLVSFAANLAKDLYKSIRLTVRMVERKIANFSNNDVHTVKVLTNSTGYKLFSFLLKS